MLHRPLRGSLLGLSMILICIGANGASAEDVILSPSKIKGAPDHIIPMSASQIAEARVRDILSEKLAATLDIAPSSLPDAETLADLERITAFADIPDPDQIETTSLEEGVVSDEVFTSEQNEADQTSLEAANNPLAGMNLTDAQMQLLIMLAMAVNDPDQVAGILEGRSQDSDHYTQTFDDHASADASIMLRGWNVRMDGFGDTYLFQESSPNSSIQLEEGIVIGALGSVTEIRKIGGEVHVFFESGDSMSGVADPEMNGIPPLTEIGERISTKGEDSTGEFFSLSQPKEFK